MSDGGLPTPGWVPDSISALSATVRTIEGLAREQGGESLSLVRPYLKAVSDRVPLLKEQAAAAGSPDDLAKVDPVELCLIIARLQLASVVASPGGKNARIAEKQGIPRHKRISKAHARYRRILPVFDQAKKDHPEVKSDEGLYKITCGRYNAKKDQAEDPIETHLVKEAVKQRKNGTLQPE